MSYLVLARKWRPQTFTDLVGQEHVRRTLENAIAQGRVAHAFLFTGVRGVGKTTSARILAKALNCEKGPTASPCLVCDPCVQIAQGNDTDVQEIDGASYNGVDEVRRLQESLPYRPQRDRFKIFIVDEVHMLSTAAWNAFLKTLEEPPPHVKFIFATTEVHKVPITILSRCQRYDFKMIQAQTIAARLRYVLGEEKIDADDATVALLSREAAGSMRDAMSLLDQAIAWGGARLVGEEVARVLGVASRTVLHELTDALVAGDAPRCLSVVAGLVENGHDLAHVARDLLAMLRDLVVARVVPEPSALLDLADDERAGTIALAQRTTADDLVRLHQGFSRGYDEIVKSASPRGGLEMALVRLARRPPLVPLDDLVSRLGELESRLGGGGGTAPRGGPGRGAPGSPQPSAGAARQAPPQRPSGGHSSSGGPFPSARTNLAEAVPIDLAPRIAAARVAPPPPSSAPTPSSRPHQAARPSARMTIVHDPSVPLPLPREGVDMAAWTRIVDRVQRELAPLASVLELAAPLAVSPAGVALGFAPNTFEAAQATDARHAELVLRAVRAEVGEAATVAIELLAEAPQLLTLARIRAAEAYEIRAALRARVVEHPLVRAAVELLDAELIDVRLGEDRSRLPPAQRSGK